MSLSDLARRLERSFRKSERLLTRLHVGLQARRTAWISARPQTVAPTDELEAIGVELRAEDRLRAAMVTELAELLPTPPGVRPQEAHVDVTRIADAVPKDVAGALRAAADEVTAVARRVRGELALGRRLLGFAQRAQESLLADLGAAGPDVEQGGYDRNARASRRGGRGAAQGHLVDGRV